MSSPIVALVLFTLLSVTGETIAQQCGSQAGGALCAGGMCCSQWGFCGTTDAYCGTGCQSQCPAPAPPLPPTGQCGSQAPCPEGQCCSKWGFCGSTDAYCGADCQSQCPEPTPSPPPPAPGPPTPPPPPAAPSPLEPLIDSALFEKLLLHRNDPACQSRGFYTYDAFITAAKSFPSFGNTGDLETRKREIAAFLAQTSHETTGGWPTAPDGPYTWGYCFITEQGAPWDYCVPSTIWPCAAGKQYFGRGPIQLSYNYNYGQAGEALGYDLLSNPDALANDAILSFRSALWFWMTPQSPKPSCHDVMTGQYQPTQADLNAGRLPGYGLTTNIINGGLECGFGTQGSDPRVESRIGFYKRYCDVFGVSYGDNLYCYNQRPFGLLLLGSM